MLLYWILDTGYSDILLDIGHWILDTGYSDILLDIGYWILDTGYYLLGLFVLALGLAENLEAGLVWNQKEI